MKTCYTLISLFIFFLTLLYAEENEDEEKLYFIAQVEFSNAQWQTSHSAIPPQLLQYDLKITLNNQHVLERTSLNADQYPIRSFEVGDHVKISKESLFYNDLSQSRFLLVIMNKDIVLDFSGKNIIEPIFDYTDAYPVINPCVKQSKFKFSIKGYSFTLDYNNFSGIYRNMPFKILEEKIISLKNGLMQAHIKGINPFTSDEYNFLSDQFKKNTFIDDSSYAQILDISFNKMTEWTGEVWDGYDNRYLYLLTHEVTIQTTKGTFIFTYNSTAQLVFADCCVPPHYSENCDYEPRKFYEFSKDLMVGEQLLTFANDNKMIARVDTGLVIKLN